MTAALIILMPKPQVGLMFAMSFPVLPTLIRFVTSLGEYGRGAINLHPKMTGICRMAYEVANVDLSPFLLAAPFKVAEQALLLSPLLPIFQAKNLADVFNARDFQSEYMNGNMLTTVAVLPVGASFVALCTRHMPQRKQ